MPLRRLIRAGVIAVAIAAGTAAPANAAIFTVNSTLDGTDQSPGDGVCLSDQPNACTLRAAIQQANFNTLPDTIVLPAGTYNLTLGASPEDGSSAGDLDITNPVTIDGAGARTTVIDQGVLERVMHVLTGTVTIEGVTIRDGRGSDQGTGLRNSANTTLVDSAVVDNVPNGMVQGAGIYNVGTLNVERSLIARNNASLQTGGGIFNNSGALTVSNSTISGNQAASGAAISDNTTSGVTNISYTTIRANTASSGAAMTRTVGGTTQIRDSIVAGNSGNGQCQGTFGSQGRNIESGTDCGFTNTANGDKQNTDPQLGALANNGGETDTHNLAPSSPAVNAAASAGCPQTDQRGVTRPLGGACDIGAVEFTPAAPPPAVPASLTLDPAQADRTPGDANVVTATARNNDGTPAAGRTIRYTIAGPNDGAGTATTDASGVARIEWAGVREGTDTVNAYVDTDGNLTQDAAEPFASAQVKWALPAPTAGRTMNIEPVSGVVRITDLSGRRGKGVGAAGATTTQLTEAKQVSISTTRVDVRSGRVQMSTVADRRNGDIQKGEFYGGVYQTVQDSRSARPYTEMRLTEGLICQPNRRGKLVPARARSRRLWGNARGRFRTRGRHSTATVRGTIWLQKDTCTKTTTVVRQGVVIVRDLGKRKNVRVRAPRRYVARRSSRR